VTDVVPDCPLLAPWYRVAAEGRRIVFEHANRAVVLEGAAVTELLPLLLPLLDGTRPVAELTVALGPAAEPAVANALALLAARGLLTAGPGLDVPAESRSAAEELAAGGRVAPAAVAARIGAATVGVAGDSRVAHEVARLLARSGVRALERRSLAEPPAADELLVAAPAADETAALAAFNARAVELEAPWLQVLPFDGRIAAIGPLFLPGQTACHACYLLRRSASLGFAELDPLLDGIPVAAPAGPALETLAAAAAAALALRWLGLADPHLPGVLFALDPSRGPLATAHLVLRVPRCPVCSGAERLAPPVPWFEPAVAEVA
jgi:bacteriocin biosynthesis cyclodehydratase domain-containing protein